MPNLQVLLYDEAIKNYNKAIEINLNDSEYFNNKGLALKQNYIEIRFRVFLTER